MASTDAINNARNAILQALADLRSGDVDRPELIDVAHDAGYKGTEGKAFRTAIKNLKDEGIITKEKGFVSVTEEGLPKLPEGKAPPSPEERRNKLIQDICGTTKFAGGLPTEEQVNDVILALLDGKVHSKKKLAEIAGYTATDTKKFRNLISAIRDRNLHVDGGKASDTSIQ